MNWKDTQIVSRDGLTVGIATGSTRQCTMESCRGTRVYVKWPDGKVTMPCSKGLRACPNGSYQIV